MNYAHATKPWTLLLMHYFFNLFLPWLICFFKYPFALTIILSDYRYPFLKIIFNNDNIRVLAYWNLIKISKSSHYLFHNLSYCVHYDNIFYCCYNFIATCLFICLNEIHWKVLELTIDLDLDSPLSEHVLMASLCFIFDDLNIVRVIIYFNFFILSKLVAMYAIKKWGG